MLLNRFSTRLTAVHNIYPTVARISSTALQRRESGPDDEKVLGRST